MLNTDKVRGIMRAKQGSQIPKYSKAGSLPLGNPLIQGKIEPIPVTDLIKSSNSMDPADLSNIKLKMPDPPKPGFKMRAKIAGKQLMQGAGDFLKQHGQAISDIGLTALNNSFNNVENSKGVDTAFLAMDTLGEAVPIVKLWSTALKGINSLGGKNAREFSIDLSTAELVGGSYGGSMADITSAAANSGKKYGLFSGSKRRKANRAMNEAERQQNIMTDIADNARDMRAMAGNDLNYLDYESRSNGGYDMRYMRAAKQGMKLLDKINFIKQRRISTGIINLDTKEIDWEPEVIVFKTGGIIESDYDIIYEIPKVEEFQKGGKTKLGFEEWFNMIPKQNRALGYDYKKAHEVLDWETLYNHTKNPDKYHLYSVSPVADENGNYPFLKLGKLEENPELQGEFDWYNSEEGAEHKSKFDIEYINDRYYYVPKKFKDGGKTKEELETPEIEETNQKNLIPEGALHKNKHHMEHTEGLTQKGIPVIDNNGEQLAEIELDEIIFTLEVTKKLEELYKDGSDKAAIEAGKLLVKEILFNTDDRTGLISKCEKGGKL